MATLVVLITSRVEEAHTIGEAWQAAGAPGVTFIEGYGLRRLQEASKSAEILPGVLSLFEILRDNEETSIVILALLENEAIVDALVAATEGVIGSLQSPNNGILFSLNVDRAVGIRGYRK